jgi:hypothetical protein
VDEDDNPGYKYTVDLSEIDPKPPSDSGRVGLHRGYSVMLSCSVCNPDVEDVEDLGMEMPDVRDRYVAHVDKRDACPKCKGKDITIVEDGCHWVCNKPGCSEEFYDRVTATCTIQRTWDTCPDCGDGVYFTCSYVLKLPDDRKYTFKSEDECFRVFRALYPNAEYDYEWAEDRRTMFMENGRQW